LTDGPAFKPSNSPRAFASNKKIQAYPETRWLPRFFNRLIKAESRRQESADEMERENISRAPISTIDSTFVRVGRSFDMRSKLTEEFRDLGFQARPAKLFVSKALLQQNAK